jgi:hypothetical protein
MKNPDIIIVLLLGILLFCLFNSSSELFNMKNLFKKTYPMFSPSSDVNSVKSNLNNSQLKVFNNILKHVKNKINKNIKQNPYNIDYLLATKQTRKLPEATIIAKMIVKMFNKQNKNHIVSLNKVYPAYAELYKNRVSLQYDINLDYRIKQNKSYSLSGFAKNTFENYILCKVHVFFPLTPKPDLSKLYVETIVSKELSNYKYLPGNTVENNYPFNKNLSNLIIQSDDNISKLLSGRETESLEKRLDEEKKKKKKKKKKNPLTKFLLNSPKVKKKESFLNKSLSETILNPPTDDINDYFSFLES